MAKYHINPKTGQPGVCTAIKKCPFATDRDHYRTEGAALDAHERKLNREMALKTDLNAQISPMADPQFIHPDRQNVAQLPEGEYFIGDPFVLLGERDQAGWNKWVKTVGRTQGWEEGVHPLFYKRSLVGAFYNGHPIVAVKTLYGESAYYSIGDGRQEPSDSGLMGLVPIEVLDELGISRKQVDNQRLGEVRKFKDQAHLAKGRFGLVMVTQDSFDNDRIPDVVLMSTKSLGDKDITSLEARRHFLLKDPNDSTYAYTREHLLKYAATAKDSFEDIRRVQ